MKLFDGIAPVFAMISGQTSPKPAVKRGGAMTRHGQRCKVIPRCYLDAGKKLLEDATTSMLPPG